MPEDRTLRWIHLADFHFGKDDYGQSKLSQRIVDFICSQAKSDMSPHLVFVTGDLANKGLAVEYDLFKTEFANKLIPVLGTEMANWLFLVPGNHDVDRNQHKGTNTYDFLSLAPQALDPTTKGLALRRDLIDRFKALVQKDPTQPAVHWLKTQSGAMIRQISLGDIGIGIIGLNTAWLSRDSDKDPTRLTPGENILEEALGVLQSCHYKIVLGHHPLNLFLRTDQQPIDTLLRKNNAIYLHGHLHKPCENRQGYRTFQTGAAFLERDDELWRNGFVWGELDTSTGELFLAPYEWSTAFKKWVTDNHAFDPEKKVQGEERWLFQLDPPIPSPEPLPAPTAAPPIPLAAAREKCSVLFEHWVRDHPVEATSRLSWSSAEDGLATDPAIDIPGNGRFVDCLCSIVAKNGNVIAILPSRHSDPDVEGVGRTDVVLGLLGLSIPYARYYCLSDTQLASLEQIKVYRKTLPPYRLVTSDMAYIGAEAGKLQAIPTKAERVSFIWDLARHIFRSTDPEYETGKHRAGEERERLLRIFSLLSLDGLGDLFCETRQMYEIDTVFVLRRERTARPNPSKMKKLVGKEAGDCLRAGLLARLKHGSRFWSTSESEINKRVEDLLGKLDLDQLDVREVVTQHPWTRVPAYALREVADLLRGQDQLPPSSRQVPIRLGTGLRYHNDSLLSTIPSVDQLRILAVSGEHVFNDVTLWECLADRESELKLDVLLLNPNSDAALIWEREAYNDKNLGFLRREIEQNTRALYALAEHYRETGARVKMRVHWYKTLPIFRLTFVGTSRIIVAAYDHGERTAYDTSQFSEVVRDSQTELFHGFERYFQSVWDESETAQPRAMP